MGDSFGCALSPSESVLTNAWFDSMENPMLLCDGSMVVLSANRAAAKLLGLSSGELLHRRADEVLAPAVPPQASPSQPRPARLEWKCEFRAPQGEPCRLEVSGIAVHDQITGAEGWALSLHHVGGVGQPPNFIGKSAIAQELLEFVSRIAASRANSILLVGESGTGKELIAKRLHALSRRARAAFLPINCAALPENLLETELFGYAMGAFTGARDPKEGLLEVADGGTVLLDEIGELPLALQAKLLRVLEDRTFRRIGGSRNISVDVCFIGATNADLEKAIAERRFRSDLYYRLNGVQIRVPALRERPDDLPDLAAFFLDHFNHIHSRQILGFHPAAKRLLDRQSWPGNVRQLRNVIERAVLVEPSPWITCASIALPSGANGVPPAPLREPDTTAHFSLLGGERELIAAAIAEAAGNQTRAARLLGIGRFSLRYKMKKLGML